MAFKVGNRYQQTFFPPVINDYVSPQDPVRVYDAFVDALDFNQLGISLIPNAGALAYDPVRMLKLLIYSYSYGLRSSRLIERACHHNLSYIWLMGDLKPDYRTIARFRGEHKDAIKKVLKQCIRMCVDMSLVDGNTLFIDGSKFRADASLSNTLSREQVEKELKKAEDSIEQLINECEHKDQEEDGQPSLVETKEKIIGQEHLAERMRRCLSKIDSEKLSSINTVDPDCVIAKSRQGTHAVHNVQCVTDNKHGLIVQAETVSKPNDNNQLLPQIKQAEENIGRKPKTVCTDAGYFSPGETKKIDPAITVVMPSPRQAHEDKDTVKTVPDPFGKVNFKYDKEHDEYICPDGKRLTHKGVDVNHPHKNIYQAKSSDCVKCSHWGACTQAKHGRKVIRSEYEDIIKNQEAIYKSEHGQEIYKLRKQKSEHPFGHFKRNLHAGQFLLRGREKVNAEISMLATCFNITRMMTIIGITKLIADLRGNCREMPFFTISRKFSRRKPSSDFADLECFATVPRAI